MAIFNEINKRSGLVVGTVVVSLILFLATDAFFGKNSIFNRNDNKVGKIAGEKISVEEYQQQLQRTEQEYQIQTNSSPKEAEKPMIQENAWNQLIFNHAYKNQFDELGLVVTEEEWLDIAKGDHIHPMVRQLFGNPPNFNKEMVAGFVANLSKYPPQDQNLWYYVDTKLPEIRIREKYTNLLKKTEYVTTAEAKREYLAQTQKANANFVTVPYYSIPDSTIQVSDSELKDYISKNKEQYKVEPGRSFDFVVFSVAPTQGDSMLINEELKELTREFASTDNDSSFLQFNSDEPTPVQYKRVGELSPDLLSQITGADSSKVYGPFLQNGSYKLYKVLGTKSDSVFSARASHILFKPAAPTPEGKAEAKKQAESVLAQIKGGASFELMARQYGTDATAQTGGDLGWFSEKDMVKPFSAAVFNSGKTGLLPNPVETDFGYHIIKVTEPKEKKLYKVAEVTKNINFSEETKENVYQKATTFAGSIKDTTEFYKKVKADKSLQLLNAKNIGPNDRNLNGVNNAREVVRWAYNDADLEDVSPVIAVDDKFVVAILTGKREKGTADVSDVKEEVTAKVRQEKKAAQIIEKLKGMNGSLQDIATKYGNSAVSGKADSVTLSSPYVAGVGYDPIAVGTIFGLKPGKRSAPVEGQGSVVILEMTNLIPAPEIADYSSYKNQLNQQRSGRTEYQLNEVIKEEAEIQDNRYKFF